jgi:thiamine-phosphate pyrophosphorylase
MACVLPPVYPLLNVTSATSRAWAQEMMAGFFDANLSVMQLRGKGLCDHDYLQWAKFCRNQCREANVRLIVNDRADIAMLSHAHGVHLGQTDLCPASVRACFGPELAIGLSCHSLQQVENTKPLREMLDYLAIGPIFATSSKQDAEPDVGLETLAQVRRHLEESSCGLPLVAIGGIQISQIPVVLKHGADSVAMISAFGEPRTVRDRAQEAMKRAT